LSLNIHAFRPTTKVNGTAARKAHLGDFLIICTYGPMNDAEIDGYEPKIVFVCEKNQITGMKASSAGHAGLFA
jgi:aspartate 1-decarboxylase